MTHLSEIHAATRATVQDLRSRYPNTPFLALGQTALWDEATKATFRTILDTLWADARMIAGVHDTDYFAKLPRYKATNDDKYALVAHDDGRTKGLWSAAGEMSAFFGSEDVSTVADLRKYAHVDMHRALQNSDDPPTLLGELTAAWGWTGIVQTEADRKTVAEIPLRDILPALLKQIEWATGTSKQCIVGDAADSDGLTQTIRRWVEQFATQNLDATLADLYRDLTPRFYELLLGAPPANLSTTSTTRLLRFNNDTCHLPRWSFVDIFLRPETRRNAENSYNLAVGGADIYTLDQFGDYALPFDMVVPGKGRGTLYVAPNGTVTIESARPITLKSATPIRSVCDLADLITKELGNDCVLVGKAISLLPMLAAEHLLIFHEGASGYTDRTRAVIENMRKRKVPLPPMYPIVRIRYSTWESMTALGDSVTLRLPQHLQENFGHKTMTAEDFGNCWRNGIRIGQDRLKELAALRSPRLLIEHLTRADSTVWSVRQRDYEASRTRLLSLWNQAQAVQGRVYTLYDQIRTLNREANSLEKAKGDDFRARIQPLRDRMPSNPELQKQIDDLQAERALTFDLEITARRAQVRYARSTVRELKERRLAIERSDEAYVARQTMHSIEALAEAQKACIAHNALQTVRGLPHTDFRPSAWWFPLVDPSGRWFRRVAETAQVYLEPLDEAA